MCDSEKKSADSVLPAGVTVLQNQGGGHMFGAKAGMVGIMLDTDGCLLKPLCPEATGAAETEELEFYRAISCSDDPVDQRLCHLVPAFHGTRTVRVAQRDVECIKLENFTYGFRHACVLDLKIGRITTEPSAPEAKRQHEASKYLGTRLPLGFSVPGMTVFDLRTDSVTQHGKQLGKHLTATSVVQAFREFLNVGFRNAASRAVCQSLVSQLELIHTWFSEQRKYHFYASSILLTYDAARLVETCSTDSARPAARMIDFAHVCPASDGLRDENYLHGLVHLIATLRGILAEISDDNES